jgi:hypothetical protein
MPVFFKAQNGLEVHRDVSLAVTGCAKAVAAKNSGKVGKASRARKSSHAGDGRAHR